MNTVYENEIYENIVSKMNFEKKSDLPGGFVVVLSKDNIVMGVISDADLRRVSANLPNFRSLKASEIMRPDFIFLFEDELTSNNLERLRHKFRERAIELKLSVQFIPILSREQKLVRVIHITDILQIWEAIEQKIIILGLGYVGLTLALSLADKGEIVYGLDQNRDIIDALKSEKSPIFEQGVEFIIKKVINRNLLVFEDLPLLISNLESGTRCFIICVGSPVTDQVLDSKQLDGALNALCRVISKGDTVILRSTVPIGFSRAFCNSITKKSGLLPGVDFYFGYAPERTLEGNAIEECRTIPQIYSGITDKCSSKIELILNKISNIKIKCESVEACEMGKLISNSYRDVIFGFSNEVANLSRRYNLDVNKLISDVNSGYPRNHIMKPSPGVGGPCLTKDSYILTNEFDFENSVIRSARKLNEELAQDFGDQITKYLRFSQKKNVLVLGLAFKGFPETNDIRNSTSMIVVNKIKEIDVNLKIFDFVIKKKELQENSNLYFDFNSNWVPDVVCILNNHKDNFSYFLSILKKVELRKKISLFDPWYLCSSIYDDGRLDYIQTLSKTYHKI